MSRASAQAFHATMPMYKRRKNIAVTTVASTVYILPFETIIYVVPPSEAVAITLEMPSAEDAEGYGPYIIWSDGNDSGTITVQFNSSETGEPALADGSLTTDQDFMRCEVIGGTWIVHDEVTT